MKSRTFVFDLDGTVLEEGFQPEPRSNATYAGTPFYDCDTRWVWDSLCLDTKVYLVTRRSHPDALRGVLAMFQLYDMRLPSGVFVNVGPEHRGPLVEALGATAWFDDDPRNFEYSQALWATPFKYLMNNPKWELNQAEERFPRINSWKEIYELIYES